jgi:hypothetical protein
MGLVAMSRYEKISFYTDEKNEKNWKYKFYLGNCLRLNRINKA